MNISIAQNPIFIVGFPRSGTTLLQSMLATQQNIHSFPETHFFSWILNEISSQSDLLDGGQLKDLVIRIHNNPLIDLPKGVKHWIEEMPPVEKIKVKDFFEKIVTSYLNETANDLSAIRWVEKTPAHIHHIKKIRSLYPNAKFIVIVRYPPDAIFSYIKSFPGCSAKDAPQLAKKWNHTLVDYLAAKMADPESILLVKYEELISGTEKLFREVCNFLGIQPEMDRLADTGSVAQQHILPFETWKKGNTKEIQKKTTSYKWPFWLRFKILFLVRTYLQMLKYELPIVDSFIVNFPYKYIKPMIPFKKRKALKTKWIFN